MHIPRMTANIAVLLFKLGQFTLTVVIFYAIYKLLLEQVLSGSKEVLSLFAIWLLSAYIVVPRVHKLLSQFYLPNYFVGRARSPSGLLSDPINLAFFGSEESMHKAMKKAGWSLADNRTPITLLKAVYSSFTSKSYPGAPMGKMYLFDRMQDFAYQQQVNNSPNERHHIRFWKVPRGWRLPGGHKADWLAAATYDTHVGIKIATGQIDHYIHEDVDNERDYIIETLKKAKTIKKLEIIEHFTDAFHDRNNGGDRIKTDGKLPFIYL
jgi:LssY C-terminus